MKLLTPEERDLNALRNKIENEFGMHSTKKFTKEQLLQIQTIIDNAEPRNH